MRREILLLPYPLWMEEDTKMLEHLDKRILNHTHHLDKDLPELAASHWTLHEQETNFSCFKAL